MAGRKQPDLVVITAKDEATAFNRRKKAVSLIVGRAVETIQGVATSFGHDGAL